MSFVESGVLKQNSSNDLIFPASQVNGTGWVHIDGNAGRISIVSVETSRKIDNQNRLN